MFCLICCVHLLLAIHAPNYIFGWCAIGLILAPARHVLPENQEKTHLQDSVNPFSAYHTLLLARWQSTTTGACWLAHNRTLEARSSPAFTEAFPPTSAHPPSPQVPLAVLVLLQSETVSSFCALFNVAQYVYWELHLPASWQTFGTKAPCAARKNNNAYKVGKVCRVLGTFQSLKETCCLLVD